MQSHLRVKRARIKARIVATWPIAWTAACRSAGDWPTMGEVMGAPGGLVGGSGADASGGRPPCARGIDARWQGRAAIAGLCLIALLLIAPIVRRSSLRP